MLMWQQLLKEGGPSGPTLIVTGEQGRLQYSLDGGKTLTQVAHGQGTATFTNIIKNAQGRLVVGVSNRKLMVSDNGRDWSVFGEVAGTAALRSIGFANNQYIAVTAGTTNTTRIYRSSNGNSWTAISTSQTTDAVYPTPATNNRSLLFSGSVGTTAATQVNAETNLASDVNYAFGASYYGHYSAFYRNGLWLAGGQGGKISTSPDTASGVPGAWTQRQGNSSNNSIMAFKYDEKLGLYVALGGQAGGLGVLVRTSPTPTVAASWTTLSASGTTSTSGSWVTAVNQGPSRVIGLANGALYTTSNWQSYTQLSGTGNKITGVYEIAD